MNIVTWEAVRIFRRWPQREFLTKTLSPDHTNPAGALHLYLNTLFGKSDYDVGLAHEFRVQIGIGVMSVFEPVQALDKLISGTPLLRSEVCDESNETGDYIKNWIQLFITNAPGLTELRTMLKLPLHADGYIAWRIECTYRDAVYRTIPNLDSAALSDAYISLIPFEEIVAYFRHNKGG